jgi:rhamnosyltransferase
MKPIMTGEPQPAPLCSIVIRAYNEEKHIGRLLAGISQQNLADLEVILVDSGSEDTTIAIATGFKASFPVRVVHIQPEEFTFGRSLNLGIREARSDIIVLASAHVYPVYPDWLERLLAPFSDQQVGLAYGRQRGNGRTRFSEQQIFAHWFPEYSQPRQSVPFCNNANAAIRRNLWEQRPYDETLSGLEDLEWARWLIQAGYAISYVAEAEIVHVHQETPRGVYNRYRREAMAFKHIYPQETFGFFDFLRLTASNIISDLWHATRRGRILGDFSSIFWFRSMQFCGTYQGYRQTGPLTWKLRRTFYYPNDLTTADENQSRKVEPIQYNDMESK